MTEKIKVLLVDWLRSPLPYHVHEHQMSLEQLIEQVTTVPYYRSNGVAPAVVEVESLHGFETPAGMTSWIDVNGCATMLAQRGW